MPETFAEKWWNENKEHMKDWPIEMIVEFAMSAEREKAYKEAYRNGTNDALDAANQRFWKYTEQHSSFFGAHEISGLIVAGKEPI